MSAQSNARPIIIKRKKVVAGGGHHGGAWKVAYADFVTAMMAFFMLMWLLNATTEQQRKGLSDYFSPTVPVSRISGGGDGSFGGDSVFSEETMPQNGTGATSKWTTESKQARGDAGRSDVGEATAGVQDEAFETLEAKLIGRGGESTVMENELRHISTKQTDEGLVIEVFSTEYEPLFEPGTTTPTPLLRIIANTLTEASRMVTNGIAVEGHVPTQPIVKSENSTWQDSLDKAAAMQDLFEDAGLPPARIKRITGHADREPATRNPMSVRNDRLEIIFVRE